MNATLEHPAAQAHAIESVVSGMAGDSLPTRRAGCSFHEEAMNGFIYDRPGRSPEQIAKRINFLALRSAARKDPNNCCKCGNPRDRDGRMCVRCLDTQRRRVARSKGNALIAGETYSLDKLAGMVLQMRREMDRMQSRFKFWQKAANYRRNLHYRTNTMRKKYLKTVSRAQAMDYLADSNHAYAEVEQ